MSATKVSARVTYWAGRGKCEPLRCLLAIGGAAVDNIFLTSAAEMRALIEAKKLAYDQVPLVEMDGLNLAQALPTAQYIAQRLGLLPTDPKLAYEAASIYASAQDARAPMVSFPFHGDRERTAAELAGKKALLGRYAPKWEAMLGKSGGPYLLGAEPSLADAGVWECLDFQRHIYGTDAFAAAFGAQPRLLAHYEACLDLGSLRAWRDEERPRLFFDDWGEYAATVRATLEF